MNIEPLVVVGIGQDGPASLGPEARTHLAGADTLAGAKRHLAFFPEFAGEKILLSGEPTGWVLKLKSRDPRRKTVVLATGDPLLYGIGRLLLASFPREQLLFLPHVSSVALAFARLKETWDDACVISLHGRPMASLLPALKRGEPKIALFTDAANHPAAIAQVLCRQGLENHYDLCVCENLGSCQKRITRWHPPELQQDDFAPLNVVVLLAKCRASESEALATDAAKTVAYASGSENLPLIGVPESAIRHRGEPSGLITKREVRLQALCYLELHHGDVLWDIGAGSGSVSLEAARLSPTLAVFAIEKSSESLLYLCENLDNFRLANIHLIAGQAPEILAELPSPNAVFVGGSGGQLLAILELVMSRLEPRGRLVVSCVTLETLSQAWNWFSERRLGPEATTIQLAHSRPLGTLHCFEPERPIFLLRAKKP